MMNQVSEQYRCTPNAPPDSVTVAVTGAAGRVGYALAFRIASGEMLGPTTSVRLRLLTTARSMAATEAMALELEDCASPSLHGVDVFQDPAEAFRGATIVLMLASAAPVPGANRIDLLRSNASTMGNHARALKGSAAADVRVLVVSNPTNTMTLIAASEAHDVPSAKFSGLSRLDHDRAVSLVARHHHIGTGAVSRVSVWGNHSDTQVPDASQLMISGRRDAVDWSWVDGSLADLVVGRGHLVRSKRSTAAASTASAAIRHIQDWRNGTPAGGWTSAAIVSDGSYGVPAGLVSSFPVTSNGNDWQIVDGLSLPAHVHRRIGASVEELITERSSI